ncbi:hypothetical protein RRG08_057339 [Elysia crispata]|uniref:Uncharacterized protein n=1 Tax=Elysia crispata TaxID=231223 RepID=A0AAE1CZM0_9GAST|nr:hypothetical protein RRG08_057339 [Elysia crispata]
MSPPPFGGGRWAWPARGGETLNRPLRKKLRSGQPFIGGDLPIPDRDVSSILLKHLRVEATVVVIDCDSICNPLSTNVESPQSRLDHSGFDPTSVSSGQHWQSKVRSTFVGDILCPKGKAEGCPFKMGKNFCPRSIASRNSHKPRFPL